MIDEQAITETWEQPHFKATFEQRVKLKDAPDLRVKGTDYHPYSLLLQLYHYGRGDWVADVLIYTSKRYANGQTSIRCTTMGLDALDEVPDWLTDLIERAKAKATEVERGANA